MNKKTIKITLEIENKKEIEEWVDHLIRKLEKANSLADESDKKSVGYGVKGISVHL